MMFNAIIYVISLSILFNYEQPISPTIHTNNAEQIVSRSVPTATPIPTAVPRSEPEKTVYKGLASFYSRSGCFGCSDKLLMANGQPLDDTKLTVAFMRAPLGTIVRIINVKTQQSVYATVTDRGGFEHLKVPKIADLSVATKEAIGCGSICDVEIEL